MRGARSGPPPGRSCGRGQAFTLEAFVASLLLLASVAFALQMAGITSLAPSTANQQIENQQRGVATGVLDSAIANGSLRPTLLYWNVTGGTFHGATEDYYVSRTPPTQFGQQLNRTFDDRNIAVNVRLHYHSTGDEIRTVRLVHYGTPSDDAVRTVQTVTLYDDDQLYDADETARSVTVSQAGGFYAPDAAPSGPVYNVLRVEVITWRA